MLKKRLIPCLIIAFLGITSSAFAQKQEIKEYTVQQGDTLWDISGKELNDPFLWPKVWKENPEIANPDRLKPGQVIRIPLYLIQKEEKPEEPAVTEPVLEKAPLMEPAQRVEAAPVRERPLVGTNLYISSGYIASTVNEAGAITGAPTMRTLFGNLDFVYVKTAGQVKAGDRFYILKKPKLIMHPISNLRVGYLVDVAGIAEIKKFEFGETVAQILTVYNDITVDDILVPFHEMVPPVISKPYRKPDIKGYIVAARHLRDNNGLFDVVYIDRGKKDGVEIGDIFRTVFIGRQTVPSGAIQVFAVNDTTSTAIVRESTISIIPGTMIMQAE
jgi:hypothetical protein